MLVTPHLLALTGIYSFQYKAAANAFGKQVCGVNQTHKQVYSCHLTFFVLARDPQRQGGWHER